MPAIDTGSTAWMLISTALVLLMTPALALFYAGMVRKKNVLSSTMHSFFAMGLVSVLWAIIGYTIAFGPDKGGLVGGLDFLGLKGVLGAVTGEGPAAIPTSTHRECPSGFHERCSGNRVSDVRAAHQGRRGSKCLFCL